MESQTGVRCDGTIGSTIVDSSPFPLFDKQPYFPSNEHSVDLLIRVTGRWAFHLRCMAQPVCGAVQTSKRPSCATLKSELPAVHTHLLSRVPNPETSRDSSLGGSGRL